MRPKSAPALRGGTGVPPVPSCPTHCVRASSPGAPGDTCGTGVPPVRDSGSHTTTACGQDLPPIPETRLPEDLDWDRLLRDYLDGLNTFFAIATSHNLSVDQLLTAIRSPRFQSRIQALTDEAEFRASRLATIRRPAALEKLAELMIDPAVTPTEQRRAASAILRAVSRSHARDERVRERVSRIKTVPTPPSRDPSLERAPSVSGWVSHPAHPAAPPSSGQPSRPPYPDAPPMKRHRARDPRDSLEDSLIPGVGG